MQSARQPEQLAGHFVLAEHAKTMNDKSSERMKVYITKYALTTGILTEDDGEVSEESPGMVSCKSLGVFAIFHGKDWHATPEAALVRAEEMRGKKIKSLEKQIAKLRVMKFKT